MSEEKSILTLPVAIVFAGIIIAGAVVFAKSPSPSSAVAAGAQQNTQNLPTQVNVPAPKTTDHIIGSPDAPIVLIEYSDFQCPYCTVVYPTIKKIVESSGGQVAWVLRNLPLESIHPQARPAAIAAECIAGLAGNDAYWKYTDAVFNNQSSLSPAYSRQLALSYGIDAAKYDTCVAQDTYKDKIDADVGDAISNGGTGTPYTVVYSKTYQAALSGALPADQFNAVIKSIKARQ
jgi:protein-disulfide isomerase